VPESCMAEQTRPLYAVLGVPADASADSIKWAYRRLALQHHPDRQRAANGSTEANATFARIAFAYEVLSHPQRRKRYDLTGEMPQSDAALGRAASDTFLAEYMKAAPTVARGVTQADMSLHSLDNYEVMDVEGKDVPDYMRGIVKIGLGYLVTMVDNMEEKEVVLLRHFVMDQMYALLAYTPPLDKDAFAERGYIITYYDHPLQAGIAPSWSDQNDLDKARGRTSERIALKEIDSATVEQRKLVALEWHGVQPAAAPAAERAQIPGEGHGPERLRLAVKELVKVEPDPMSFSSHSLRRALEKLLCLAPQTLDSERATMLMGLVMEALEEEEEVEEKGKEETKSSEPGPAAPEPAEPASAKSNFQATVGSKVRVLRSGRTGEVVLHDPDDPDLTYKVKFDDGAEPATDWCAAGAVGSPP